MSDRPEAKWFTARGKVHVEEPAKTETLGTLTSHCGLSPLSIAPDVIQTLTVDDIPTGEPCMKCLVWVGLQSIEEEPLEHAKSRGVIPFESMDELGNL